MRHASVVFLLVLAALSAWAANFSGKWTIQPASGRGGGRGAAVVLELNQVGSEVTGSIAARIDAGSASPVGTEVLGGKVEGDSVSFYVWTGVDQPVKTFYRGTLSASGEEIQFAITGGPAGGRGQAAPQQLTARRSK
jgi:hypothetical protein